MARIPAALAQAGLKTRMLLQVHDELLFEVPEAEADDTAQRRQGGHGRRLRAALRALGAARRRDRPWQKLGRGALGVVTERIEVPCHECRPRAGAVGGNVAGSG